MKKIILLSTLSLFLAAPMRSGTPAARESGSDAWTFCSIPDFLNFDIEYPQEGWEDALGFVLESMKREEPAFVVVPGDLVMGHWGTDKAEIDKWADKYYPMWIQRFRDHDLKVYASVGDHEVGDNPWRKPERAEAVAHYKEAFRRHLGMPLNGPAHMKGTAFFWTHRNALFVSVDVFEEGESRQGRIAGGVTGKQLEWFEGVLREHRDQVDHIIVTGHIPVLDPVRRYSSSGMLTVEGRESEFWRTMARYGVDLYLCGEVHAVTSIRKDGILQLAHGGLFGRTSRPNYLVVTVHPDRLELAIKEIELVNGTGRLWQHNKERGPWDTITITEERKREGFTTFGTIDIVKQGEEKSFQSITGPFDESDNPTRKLPR